MAREPARGVSRVLPPRPRSSPKEGQRGRARWSEGGKEVEGMKGLEELKRSRRSQWCCLLCLLREASKATIPVDVPNKSRRAQVEAYPRIL